MGVGTTQRGFVMESGFAVDFAWLDRLTTAFDSAVSATDAALDALHETGPIRTGHKQLDKACDHFKKKWDDRVDDFRERIDDFRGAVIASKKAYNAAEEHAAASLTPEVDATPAFAGPDAADAPIRSVLDPVASAAPQSGGQAGAAGQSPSISIREVLG